jgi:hypothetical protein
MMWVDIGAEAFQMKAFDPLCYTSLVLKMLLKLLLLHKPLEWVHQDREALRLTQEDSELLFIVLSDLWLLVLILWLGGQDCAATRTRDGILLASVDSLADALAAIYVLARYRPNAGWRHTVLPDGTDHTAVFHQLIQDDGRRYIWERDRLAHPLLLYCRVESFYGVIN